MIAVRVLIGPMGEPQGTVAWPAVPRGGDTVVRGDTEYDVWDVRWISSPDGHLIRVNLILMPARA